MLSAWPDSFAGHCSRHHKGAAVSTAVGIKGIRSDKYRARNSSKPTSPHSNRFAPNATRPFSRLAPAAFASATAATLVFAWIEREEGYLTADSGTGYWLGIAGAGIMLMLFAYPLRKRLRALHRIGRVANWFRFHMVFGIIGPTLVVLHTNFKLGSLNSRLALFTMLLVVASGIVGRYLYAKVHRGLYGKHVELRDVLDDILEVTHHLGTHLFTHPRIQEELERHVPKITSEPSSFLTSFVSAATAGPRTRASHRRIMREIRKSLSSRNARYSSTRRQRRAELREIDNQLRIFFAAARKAERFAFFETLFGMWHHFHLPLFILLALTVTIHIIAVHLY
jgi:hypothetical protein